MVGHGGSSAGSYLADPTSPISSHCASIVATLRVKSPHFSSSSNTFLTLTVLVMTIDALQHFETG